jgi:hypothetical protein
MVDLGRVHADVANLLDALGEPDVDRVAVHDAHHRAFERCLRRDGDGKEQDEDGDEPARSASHGSTLSRRGGGRLRFWTVAGQAVGDGSSVLRRARSPMSWQRTSIRTGFIRYAVYPAARAAGAANSS